MPPFGAPGVVVSNSATCFWAQKNTRTHGAPRSRMTDSPRVRSTVEREGGKDDRNSYAWHSEAFEPPRQAAGRGGAATVVRVSREAAKGLFVTVSVAVQGEAKIVPTNFGYLTKPCTVGYRKTELLALLGPRAARSDAHKFKVSALERNQVPLRVGDDVTVAYGDVFKRLQWPPLKSRCLVHVE